MQVINMIFLDNHFYKCLNSEFGCSVCEFQFQVMFVTLSIIKNRINIVLTFNYIMILKFYVVILTFIIKFI